MHGGLMDAQDYLSVRAPPPGFALTCFFFFFFLLPVEHAAPPLSTSFFFFLLCSKTQRECDRTLRRALCVSGWWNSLQSPKKKQKKQFTKTKQSHVHFSWPLEICVIVRQTHCISQSQDGIGNSFNMQGVMFNSVLLPFLHVSCHDV